MQKRTQGKLIVLEGTDGSGKTTQFRLLSERFEKEGHHIVTLKFPQYGKKSAGLVEEYLNGTYGTDPADVSPYAASLFYALDRFDAAFKIRQWLEEGKIVLLDRYVDSNAGHQGGKIRNAREREKFLAWLYDLEYRILGVPKPDRVIILHVPSSMNQALMSERTKRHYLKKGTHDIHEADIAHLKAAESSYLWLAKKFPRDHTFIECVKDNRLLTREEVHELVWKAVGRLV